MASRRIGRQPFNARSEAVNLRSTDHCFGLFAHSGAGCWPVYRVAGAARRAARSGTAVIGVNESDHDAHVWPRLELSPGDDVMRGLLHPGFVTLHVPMLKRLRARRRGARDQLVNALCETDDLCS